MNVKRFVGRNSHEALQRLKQALGPDAVVLSTRPCAEGVELLAMGPDASGGRSASDVSSDVRGDAQTLSMSTLSFQDYVRDRMMRRRQDLQSQGQRPVDSQGLRPPAPSSPPPHIPQRPSPIPVEGLAGASVLSSAPDPDPRPAPKPASKPAPKPVSIATSDPSPASPSADAAALMAELLSVKGLIEQRFGALTFLERLQRQPAQAQLAQRLLEAGFSPALSRKLIEVLPAQAQSQEQWVLAALERNLRAAEQMPALEEQGGVFALVGATGVGKTTTTAKLAAAFAARHGASSLGLITLDAYRVGAQEQLRAYGRILGVPVHSAHDRASLEDLLSLLSDKRMVLIDTAGMAQRDSRTREMLDMLGHSSIQRLLVLNAAAQGETLDDVVVSWKAAACAGVVLSKVDEAVRLGPALDTLIRHKLPVLGVANGQRVPEDWHRLTAQALLQRALRDPGRGHWRLDPQSVELIFADIPLRSTGTAPGAPMSCARLPAQVGL